MCEYLRAKNRRVSKGETLLPMKALEQPCHHRLILLGRRADQQVDVPRPPVWRRVVDFRTVAELVAVLVNPSGKVVVEGNPLDMELLKRVELVRLGNPVVVGIDPQPQLGIDGVAGVYQSVAVSAVLRLVKHGECKKPVRIVRRGLWGYVAEQFRAVVDPPIAIPIQSKECIGGPWSGPGDLRRLAGVEQVKFHSSRLIRQVEARTVHVDKDRSPRVGALVRVPIALIARLAAQVIIGIAGGVLPQAANTRSGVRVARERRTTVSGGEAGRAWATAASVAHAIIEEIAAVGDSAARPVQVAAAAVAVVAADAGTAIVGKSITGVPVGHAADCAVTEAWRAAGVGSMALRRAAKGRRNEAARWVEAVRVRDVVVRVTGLGAGGRGARGRVLGKVVEAGAIEDVGGVRTARATLGAVL